MSIKNLIKIIFYQNLLKKSPATPENAEIMLCPLRGCGGRKCRPGMFLTMCIQSFSSGIKIF